MYGNNFYNPYMNYGNFMNASNIANASRIGRMGANVSGTGLFSNLFRRFNLNGFLTGASKTLNVVNQAIPIYYQVKPMISNAKTMFRVMSAVKDTNSNDTPTKTKTTASIKKASNSYKKENSYDGDGSPTFFI